MSAVKSAMWSETEIFADEESCTDVSKLRSRHRVSIKTYIYRFDVRSLKQRRIHRVIFRTARIFGYTPHILCSNQWKKETKHIKEARNWLTRNSELQRSFTSSCRAEYQGISTRAWLSLSISIILYEDGSTACNLLASIVFIELATV